MSYVPAPGKWETRSPESLGLRPDGLRAAIEFHRTHESRWPRDFITKSGRYIGVDDEPPESTVLGPVRPRGGPNGIVVRHGHIAAEWGDTGRADMTFSVAKSYLALLAGLAIDRGRFALDDPVRATVHDGGFDSAQNRECLPCGSILTTAMYCSYASSNRLIL